jgi:hypothetical protein
MLWNIIEIGIPGRKRPFWSSELKCRENIKVDLMGKKNFDFMDSIALAYEATNLLRHLVRKTGLKLRVLDSEQGSSAISRKQKAYQL